MSGIESTKEGELSAPRDKVRFVPRKNVRLTAAKLGGGRPRTTTDEPSRTGSFGDVAQSAEEANPKKWAPGSRLWSALDAACKTDSAHVSAPCWSHSTPGVNALRPAGGKARPADAARKYEKPSGAGSPTGGLTADFFGAIPVASALGIRSGATLRGPSHFTTHPSALPSKADISTWQKSFQAEDYSCHIGVVISSDPVGSVRNRRYLLSCSCNCADPC
jgi:hypothetical protein